MSRNSRLLGLLVAAAVTAVAPVVARAEPENQAAIGLHIQVQSFCQVVAPTEAPLTFNNGAADIGVIKQVCNSPRGSITRATFSNVSGGTLVIGSDVFAVDASGAVQFATPGAHVDQQTWSLSDVTLQDNSQPVQMTVKITAR